MSTQQFKREIKALSGIKSENVIHPLTKEQIKQRVLLEISLEHKIPSGFSLSFKFRHAFKYILAGSLGLSLFTGTVLAANKAMPGDTLYPIKIAKENLELNMAAQPKTKAKIIASHAQIRIEELEEIKTTNKSEKIQKKAQEKSRAQVISAIESLNEVKNQLKQEGNNSDLNDVENNLSELKIKARKQNIISEKEQKVEREQEKEQRQEEFKREENKQVQKEEQFQQQEQENNSRESENND